MNRYFVRRCLESPPNWLAAEIIHDFVFPWENRPAPKTEFRALWDEKHFHFRFECQDDDLVLPDVPASKERVLGSDRVEIFFTPDLSLKPYYCLEMTPKGDVLAYKASFYRETDWDWQCEGLQIATKIENNHYTVTGSLPLDTLREISVLKPGSPEILAGIYRAEFHHQPDGAIHSGWMPWVNPQTARPDFHVPASFGMIELSP